MTTPAERPEHSGTGPAPEASPTSEPPEAPHAAATTRSTFEESAEAFGRRAEESVEAFGQRAEALGREAEEAAQRWSSSPAVKGTADAVSRVWGLVLLAVGTWFFADITLAMTMSSIAWRDVWPLALIAFGGYVVLKGMTRRT